VQGLFWRLLFEPIAPLAVRFKQQLIRLEPMAVSSWFRATASGSKNTRGESVVRKQGSNE
jgi:hypothetical protein